MALRTSLVAQPHLYIGDTTGRPLDGGKVYFGQVNKDPELYPINVFYDEKLTIAAPQPVRTKGGFMNANGNMTEVYASETRYSVKVIDSYGRQVFYKPDMQSDNDVSDEVSDINDLPLLLAPTNGTKVYVKSVEKNFIFTTTPTSPINTGTVIQGIGGVWEMEIQSSYYASMFCPDSSIDNVNEPQEDNINAGYCYATSKGRPFIIDKDYYVKSKKREGNQAYPPISTENAGALWYAVRTLSNSVLSFIGGAKLKLVPTSEPFTAIIMTFDVENYVILDPHTIGDKDTHLVTTGEQGINMHFGASKNGYVRNPICENSWGDGMYFGFAFYCKPIIDVYVPTNLVIDNPTINNVSRNGVSLCGANNVKFNNLYVEKVDRTAPFAGIDIEPEEDANFTIPMFIRDVVFNNTTLVGCKYSITSYIFGNREVEVQFTGTTKIIAKNDMVSWHTIALSGIRNDGQAWVDFKQSGYVTIDYLVVDDTKASSPFRFLAELTSPVGTIKYTINRYDFISTNAAPEFHLAADESYEKAEGVKIRNISFVNPVTSVTLTSTSTTGVALPSMNYRIEIPESVEVFNNYGAKFHGNCYIGGHQNVTLNSINAFQCVNKVIVTPTQVGGTSVVTNVYIYEVDKGRSLKYSLNSGLNTAQIGDGLYVRIGSSAPLISKTPKASIAVTVKSATTYDIDASYGAWA